jgi:hypothetical protein
MQRAGYRKICAASRTCEIAFHCSALFPAVYRALSEGPNSPFPALLGAFFV